MSFIFLCACACAPTVEASDAQRRGPDPLPGQQWHVLSFHGRACPCAGAGSGGSVPAAGGPTCPPSPPPGSFFWAGPTRFVSRLTEPSHARCAQMLLKRVWWQPQRSGRVRGKGTRKTRRRSLGSKYRPGKRGPGFGPECSAGRTLNQEGASYLTRPKVGKIRPVNEGEPTSGWFLQIKRVLWCLWVG